MVPGVHGILRYWGFLGPRYPGGLGGAGGRGGPGVAGMGPTFLPCQFSTKCFNVKSLTYYFHVKTTILVDFQICIIVP